MLHPLPLVAEQARDGVHRELVLVEQGAHHSRLVEHGESPSRRVGDEQESLLLGRGQRALDDHGDRAPAALTPAGEPFQSIDHLVAAGGGDNAEGQICALLGSRGQRARSQARVASAELFDAHEANAARDLLRLRRREGDGRTLFVCAGHGLLRPRATEGRDRSSNIEER
jgi:hypothetical protein